MNNSTIAPPVPPGVDGGACFTSPWCLLLSAALTSALAVVSVAWLVLSAVHRHLHRRDPGRNPEVALAFWMLCLAAFFAGIWLASVQVRGVIL